MKKKTIIENAHVEIVSEKANLIGKRQMLAKASVDFLSGTVLLTEKPKRKRTSNERLLKGDYITVTLTPQGGLRIYGRADAIPTSWTDFLAYYDRFRSELEECKQLFLSIGLMAA